MVMPVSGDDRGWQMYVCLWKMDHGRKQGGSKDGEEVENLGGHALHFQGPQKGHSVGLTEKALSTSCGIVGGLSTCGPKQWRCWAYQRHAGFTSDIKSVKC